MCETSDGGAVPLPTVKTIRLAHLRAGQRIRADVHFTVGTCRDHARFMRVAAVGMRPTPGVEGDHFTITFDTLFDDDAEACVAEALQSLRARVRRAKALVDEYVALRSSGKGEL